MPIEHVETGAFAKEEIPLGQTTALRLVTWNIARGTQLDAIAEFLATASADVIVLQETDTNARRTGYRDVAKEIARKLGMNYAFGVEFQELAEGSPDAPAYHGQATLSRWPLSGCRILRFRKQSKFWHPYWWMPRLATLQRRLGGRMALLSHVTIGDRMVVVYNLHLESRNSDDLRRSQLAELFEDAHRYGSGTPMVVAGDFNFDLTESSVASAIEEMHFHNPFKKERVQTTRSRSLARSGTIDGILTRGPLDPTVAQVHRLVSASDHYPLVLDLKLS
jgi:endonuclease/exonuclease/phosphatase family metal-dependent hydrolase